MLADALLALPGLLLVLIVLAIFSGTDVRFWAGLLLVLWVEFFRLTRVATRETLASPAVQTSRLLGFGPIYTFRVHRWPGIAPIMLTAAAVGTATGQRCGHRHRGRADQGAGRRPSGRSLRTAFGGTGTGWRAAGHYPRPCACAQDRGATGCLWAFRSICPKGACCASPGHPDAANPRLAT